MPEETPIPTPEPTNPPAPEPKTPDAPRDEDADSVEKLKEVARKEREARKAAEKDKSATAAELEELRKFRQEIEDRDKTEADKAADKAAKAEAKAADLTARVETLQAERDALAEIVTARVATEVKDWPAEVKALIPDDGDLIARLGAIEKARPIAAKLMEAPKTPGNGYDPRPLGGAGHNAAEAAGRERIGSFVGTRF